MKKMKMKMPRMPTTPPSKRTKMMPYVFFLSKVIHYLTWLCSMKGLMMTLMWRRKLRTMKTITKMRMKRAMREMIGMNLKGKPNWVGCPSPPSVVGW